VLLSLALVLGLEGQVLGLGLEGQVPVKKLCMVTAYCLQDKRTEALVIVGPKFGVQRIQDSDVGVT